MSVFDLPSLHLQKTLAVEFLETDESWNPHALKIMDGRTGQPRKTLSSQGEGDRLLEVKTQRL